MARTSSLSFSPFSISTVPFRGFQANTWAAYSGTANLFFTNVVVDGDDNIFAIASANNFKNYITMKISPTGSVLWSTISATTNATTNVYPVGIAFQNTFISETGLHEARTANTIAVGTNYIMNTAGRGSFQVDTYRGSNGQANAIAFPAYTANGSSGQQIARLGGRWDYPFHAKSASVLQYGFNGGLYLAGYVDVSSSTTAGYPAGVLIKYEGAFPWQRGLGGYISTQISTAGLLDARALWPSPTGNVYVGVQRSTSEDMVTNNTNTTPWGILLWCYNSSGTLQFQRSYRSSATGTSNSLYSVTSLTGFGANVFMGGMIAANNTNTTRTPYVISTHANGAVRWSVRHSAGFYVTDMHASSDGFVYYIGNWSSGGQIVGRMHQTNGSINWARVFTPAFDNGRRVAIFERNGKLYVTMGKYLLKLNANGADIPIGTISAPSSPSITIATQTITTTNLPLTTTTTSYTNTAAVLSEDMRRSAPIVNLNITSSRTKLS